MTKLLRSQVTGEHFAVQPLPEGGYLMSPPLTTEQVRDISQGIKAGEDITIDGECVGAVEIEDMVEDGPARG